MTAKELREQRAALAAEIRRQADRINAEGRDFSAEEKEGWERVNADYNALTRRIEVAERAEAVEAEQRAPAGDVRLGQGVDAGLRGRPPLLPAGEPGREDQDRTRALAMQAWFLQKQGQYLSDEHAEACQSLRFNPSARELVIPLLSSDAHAGLQRAFRSAHPSHALERALDPGLRIGATLSQQVGPSGAYLTPPEQLIRRLEVNLLAYGGMRQVAETITTTTGERISWPTVDDTFNKGVQLGENAQVASLTSGGTGQGVDPTFAKVFWDAYVFTSQPVLVPYTLLQDSVFALPEFLGEAFGIRIGRVTNDKYTTGSGQGTAKGLLTAATSFGAAGPTAVTFDDVLGLIHAIDPAYRTADCGFMCHDQVLLAIRKLKDGVGRYLWEPGVQNGVPDRIWGYPHTNNQSMDSTIASGKKSLVFGQLKKYKIRRVGEMRMYHLVERYRDYDQDAFLAFVREDGNLLTAGTPPVKYLQH